MIPPADPDRPSAEIIFRVDDREATLDLLRSRGAEFLTQPVDWGHERRAFLRDPDGHLFEISELRNSWAMNPVGHSAGGGK